MIVSIDTKQDSPEDIKRAIKFLQNIVGDSGEIDSNQTVFGSNNAQTGSAFANIFGDDAQSSQPTGTPQEPAGENKQMESSEDLFAELFSEEEIKKMDVQKEAPEEPQAKGKKYDIELY